MEGPAFEVRRSATSGQGVFAQRAIARGEQVLELTGERLATSDVSPLHYCVKVDDDQWLCSLGGRTDDYLNHSCDANLGFTQGDLRLFAIRDIAAGEELTFDYAMAMCDVDDWGFNCSCGARDCRGRVEGFNMLRPRFQRKLRPFALAYIRRMFNTRRVAP
ncbi:MAG: SET domain-containing protein [Planctomycetes bacterium]|nr:SET domain-containing protein [Planctomycetota bacterium]